ncbi:MAG: type IV pilus biogenesis protein PilM [Sedimentibacter sp.]
MVNLLVVELNDDNIKIMEGSRKEKTLTVYKCVSVVVPINSIKDGKMLGIDVIKEIMKKALLGNLIKTKRTVFIINSSSVITRKIELPYLKSNKQTKSMINFKLQEIMYADLNQYKMMYKTKEIFISEGIKKASYIVCCMPIKIYNQYLKLADELNLDLAYLDISPNLLENIFKYNLAVNNKEMETNISSAFLNANKDTISFSVINKGVTEFFRISHINTDKTKYTENVAETEAGYYNSSLSVSEDGKDEWIDEIGRYIRYYCSLNKQNIIEKIYLYGDNIKLLLNNEIFSDFNVHVETINDVSNMTVNYLAEEELTLNKYFNLFLAFYSSKNDVNFLKDRHQYHKYKFNIGVALMSATLILLMLLTYYALNYFSNVNKLENDATAMSMFINNKANMDLDFDIEDYKNNVDSLKKYYIKAVNIKKATEKEDTINSEMFVNIKEAAPYGTIINSIYINKDNIELQCNSITLEQVAVFIGNIRAMEFVGNVYMPSVEIIKEEQISSYSYVVICKLKDELYEE